jgi:hypothetical protein
MDYEEEKQKAKALLVAADGYHEVNTCAVCAHVWDDREGSYECQRVTFEWTWVVGARSKVTTMPVDPNGVCNKFERQVTVELPPTTGGTP